MDTMMRYPSALRLGSEQTVTAEEEEGIRKRRRYPLAGPSMFLTSCSEEPRAVSAALKSHTTDESWA
mgnify:CR=1 FL=1